MPLPETLSPGEMPTTRGVPARSVDANSLAAGALGRGEAIRRQGGVAPAGGGAAAQAAAAVAAGIPASAMPTTLANAAALLASKNAARIAPPRGSAAAKPLVESVAIAEHEGLTICSIALDGGKSLVLVPAYLGKDRMAERVGTPAFVPVPAGVRQLDYRVEIEELDAPGFSGACFRFPGLGGRLLVLTAHEEGELTDLSSAWLVG
jgi:hypothetical protein